MNKLINQLKKNHFGGFQVSCKISNLLGDTIARFISQLLILIEMNDGFERRRECEVASESEAAGRASVLVWVGVKNILTSNMLKLNKITDYWNYLIFKSTNCITKSYLRIVPSTLSFKRCGHSVPGSLIKG